MMDTPKLDELLKQARLARGYGGYAQYVADRLFATHGPALVAVLQYYAKTAIGVRAYDVLAKLEQEAACQK